MTCRYGHTDVAHAQSWKTVGLCRERYEGDTCENPAPLPYVCACVSEKAAFAAQDKLGEEARWYFVFIGMACLVTSLFMLVLRIFAAFRDWCRRRFWNGRGGLRYARTSSRESEVKLDGVRAEKAAAAKVVHEEVEGLWQCALFTTFALALIGGPTLLYLSVPEESASNYFMGCGFPIPIVYLVVARPEFGLNAAG